MPREAPQGLGIGVLTEARVTTRCPWWRCPNPCQGTAQAISFSSAYTQQLPALCPHRSLAPRRSDTFRLRRTATAVWTLQGRHLCPRQLYEVPTAPVPRPLFLLWQLLPISQEHLSKPRSVSRINQAIKKGQKPVTINLRQPDSIPAESRGRRGCRGPWQGATSTAEVPTLLLPAHCHQPTFHPNCQPLASNPFHMPLAWSLQ